MLTKDQFSEFLLTTVHRNTIQRKPTFRKLCIDVGQWVDKAPKMIIAFSCHEFTEQINKDTRGVKINETNLINENWREKDAS